MLELYEGKLSCTFLKEKSGSNTADVPDTVTGLSVIVLFVESFMEMTRFREKWLMYRNTCNQLLSIQRQNAMHTYKEEDEKCEARLQYVQAVEKFVGYEPNQWYAVN